MTLLRPGRWATAALVVAAAAAPAAVGPAASAASTMTVVASGLNNPRGMTFKGSTLYVAEAGLGSGTPATGAQLGAGATGSITMVRGALGTRPVQSRVATGLSSYAYDEGGPQTLGIEDVAVDGSGAAGGLLGIFGEPGASGTTLGDVVRFPRRGAPSVVSSVGAADYAWTAAHTGDAWAPTNQFPDANPYGVVVAGGRTFALDAGANTLDEVLADGTVQVLAFIPDTPTSDSVPTCLAKGPDGALYVGTMALEEYLLHGPGTATVYRVDPRATDPTSLAAVLGVATVWATGFSTITGCTFSSRGAFYAAEMLPGDVVEAPFATPQTGRTTYGAGRLTRPDDVVVDRRGDVYVSDVSSSPSAGAGRVVRFTP